MAPSINNQTVEVILPNEIGYERIAMACSASFARLSGLNAERIEDLKTAVAEACTNAMEHGNHGRPDARVVVSMQCNGDKFSIRVSDEGQGIQSMPEEPDIDKKMEGLQTPRGLGLFLIRKLVDQVDFNEISPKGHTVKMVIQKGE